MSDIEREQPNERGSIEGTRASEELPEDAPAAGVVDPELDDPPEPNEPA